MKKTPRSILALTLSILLSGAGLPVYADEPETVGVETAAYEAGLPEADDPAQEAAEQDEESDPSTVDADGDEEVSVEGDFSAEEEAAIEDQDAEAEQDAEAAEEESPAEEALPSEQDSEEAEEEEAAPISLSGEKSSAAKASRLPAQAGEAVTGSFKKISGMSVATIRYYTDPDRTEYAFAEFEETGDGYAYTFDAPFEGFEPAEGSSEDPDGGAGANIVAEYYSLTKWDGAVDVSWYDETSASFDIGDPAQLAGLAAIVNGSINTTTPIYRVKGERSDLSRTFSYDTPQTSKHQDINEGLPSCIENKYYERTALIASVQDEAYEGLPKHDFANRVVNLTADLDMGGTDPSHIDHSKNESENAYEGIYPNWTPIGGEYLMDPSRAATMIKASFNGTINGNGHHITNLYCYRWSYRSVGDTAYGYAQGTGLIGVMGSLYDGEAQPEVVPALRDMSLSGYVYGRRMVGGFVGCMGGGANAASGQSLECGINLENLANHADVHCTDSKGLGGIVACSMLDKGNIINCYNTGYMDANYAAPSGGIIGSNEGMNVYCCYNIGTVYSHGNKRGRGIGCNSSGSNYKVDDCYYLEGCGDDDAYPGYYTYNLAKSVSVHTEAMTEAEMTNGTLLEKLNVNGTAFVQGAGGYPVLYWEKNPSPGTGSLTIENKGAGGTVTASREGTLKNGTVVYLEGTPETGRKCRYFLNNGARLSGSHVTVNGSSVIKGYFEEVTPGTIRITSSDVCTVAITKNGIIMNGETAKAVTDYPVRSGDPVYEGDFLMVKTTFKKGSVPKDEDRIYQASAPDFFSNPYEFTYAYVDEDGEANASETTGLETFTVSSDINGAGIILTLGVKALTAQKMWDYRADTSWYSDSKKTFTISNARQLAGLSVLVDEGKTFAGKTVTMSRDISLKNDDGTSGKRFWDGIGSSRYGFAGTFDGGGHKITDYCGNANGLFEYCEGTSESSRAVVKNLELWGTSSGQNACGFIMKAKNTLVSKCASYCTVSGTTSNGHSAAILGYATGNCAVDACLNYAEVSGKGYVGGIIGELSASSSVTDSINKGNILCLDAGGNNVGGIAGSLSGQLLRSANYGNIRSSGRNTGGIAGQSVSAKALIDGCSNVGSITYRDGTGSTDSLGGIIGFASIFCVKNSFNYGPVERQNGALPDANLGGVFGREARNSKSLSENVYYLDTACAYAEAGTAPEELNANANYSKGIHAATAAQFALANEVLAQLNGAASSPAYALTNGTYPELRSASGTHVHSGGSATCSALAVCDDCGLSYGLYSDQHGGTKVSGAKEAVWLTDGYSGDICCKECGEVLTKGRVIPADPDRQAISFIVRTSDNNADIRTYTVGEFDSLKTADFPVGYSYGSKSEEITAASQYVTLDRVLEDLGVKRAEVSSIVVECTGSKSTLDAKTLSECNRYYEGEEEFDAPAAFMISWNTGKGTLEEIAGDASIGGTIRFGYGISEAQKTEAVGGARLVSPVETVTINVGEAPEAASIGSASVRISDQTYTGGLLTPEPEVQLGGKVLKEGTDYRLIYTNNLNVGQAKVIVVGIGSYTGSRSEFFRIRGVSIGNAEVTVGDGVSYTGLPRTPAVKVTVNGTVLTEGLEYSVSYKNNTEAGTASVEVTGIGNYEGTASGTFTIAPRSLAKASVFASDTVYSGKAAKPEVTVTMAGKVLTAGMDYELSYADNVSAGTARILIKGKGNYSGTASGTFRIARKSLSGGTVSGIGNKVYTGKALTPKPAVTLNGGKLTASRDYKVSYANNTKVGTATVTVTGTGNYDGKITKTFQISPKKAAVSSAKVKKGRKLTIRIKAAVSKTGGTRYAVQYRIKGNKKWTTKYTTKKTLTLKKLKKGKKYQVRVRACKGSSYGAWSAVKTTAKIRK